MYDVVGGESSGSEGDAGGDLDDNDSGSSSGGRKRQNILLIHGTRYETLIFCGGWPESDGDESYVPAGA